MNSETLRKKIIGPAYPIPPAFTADEALDYTATARYVTYLNHYAVRTLVVTAGTSRFNLLSRDEIVGLNRAVIEANEGKAIVIAANPMTGSTSDAIRFAQEVHAMGADVLLVYYPERYYGDARVYDYFAAILEASPMPIMIHANPMRHASGGQAFFSIDLCRRLTQYEHFIGMKEEHLDPTHRYKLAVNLSDRMAFIVAGGGMRTFMSCYLFGIQATLTSIGSFRPDIEERFYQKLMENQFSEALAIVRQEERLFDVAVPIGWHIAFKSILDIMGLMPPYERRPLQPPTADERARLQALLKELGWV